MGRPSPSAGQPTKYSAAILKKANAYVSDYKTEHEHAIPSIAGLAVVLGVCRKTIQNWAKNPKNKEFLHTLDKISTNQEFKLLNGGLTGTFNAAITKLVLYNHGYNEKAEPIEEDAPPLEYTFNVKPAKAEIKTTNAKS